MEFKQSVIEALQFYVYCLVDPRDNKIFYVGKGKGNRVFQHAMNALDESADSLKLNTIRDIIKTNLSKSGGCKQYLIRTHEINFIQSQNSGHFLSRHL